ncbi:MAG: nicotinate-nucleotide adenylyltransferase [Verrucomicrobia bacterium TMED44]|nr:MAG: nicotinate-nucleotide adenylyltransferase [Verrucomicrobia bacterium TMED44]
MSTEQLAVERKALRINLDSLKYGTFAEIGAGQEVARHFFQAGGAAGTVAKTMSAYDMKFSDKIYGEADRYVSRKRLVQMMEHEFRLLQDRLSGDRGKESQFFAFSNTVSALNFHKTNECHGWMGIRFQLEPLGEMHDIILHVRMLDRENRLQQEAIGVLGVNLVYGAFHHHENPDEFIQSLADGISTDRVELDMIEFNGPHFEKFDNRILCLKLTQAGLTDAIMFDTGGHVVQSSEVLYKKSCLIERGSFRPVTKVNLDMLENARNQFIERDGVDEDELMVFMELTLGSLANEGSINYEDFISRIEVINACGYGVLVSNYFEYYKLASYLRRLVKKPIGLVMGLNNLADIFKQEYYANLEGGILEAFGVLFKDNIRIYAYPVEKVMFERYRKQFRRGDNVSLKESSSGLINVENLLVADNLRNLYKFIRENQFLETIRESNRNNMKFFSRDIFEQILNRQEGWQDNLPETVAQMIDSKNLWQRPES